LSTTDPSERSTAGLDSNDANTTVDELRQMVRKFVSERNWERFHAPKNISMALAIEASELMEHFQWMEIERSRSIAEEPELMQAVREEIADVVCYAMAMCNELDVDLASCMREKMVKNRQKYPLDQADEVSGQ
jgi:NTP pyrophosphatase (non-canonical NTP hydrolase)